MHHIAPTSHWDVRCPIDFMCDVLCLCKKSKCLLKRPPSTRCATHWTWVSVDWPLGQSGLIYFATPRPLAPQGVSLRERVQAKGSSAGRLLSFLHASFAFLQSVPCLKARLFRLYPLAKLGVWWASFRFASLRPPLKTASRLAQNAGAFCFWRRPRSPNLFPLGGK